MSLISKTNSLILKGGGILLMLFHHLFYSPLTSSLFRDYHVSLGGYDIAIVNQLGIYGKLCVAIFVFASGYGLETLYLEKKLSMHAFYKHRFKKLYMNYWFIWFLFVPVGIFLFGRTFSDVYGNNIILKLVCDFLGVLKLLGHSGYNPTWWFYSCIILLYLVFPIFHKYLSNGWLLLLSACIIVANLSFLPIITYISNYFLPFVVGMWIARLPISIFDRCKVIEIVIAFLFLSAIRNMSNMMCVIDTLLAVTLAIFIYKVRLYRWLQTILVELGKHSQNIFLFHTFIFFYWFREETYITREPLIIFTQLTIVCYLISVVIEFIKKKIGFYNYANK